MVYGKKVRIYQYNYFFSRFLIEDYINFIIILTGLRDPNKSKIWFGDRKGGFEKPSRDKAPSIVSLPELKVKWVNEQDQRSTAPTKINNLTAKNKLATVESY